MARGWESKSVESQIDAAEERAALAKLPKLTPEEAERKQQRESLQLTRVRVMHDLETSKNPHYRASLEAALKHLDDKIAALA
jgi:putative heme iron utilization protein